MWPDRVSNRGPLALESDTLPTALYGPVVRDSLLFHILKMMEWSRLYSTLSETKLQVS